MARAAYTLGGRPRKNEKKLLRGAPPGINLKIAEPAAAASALPKGN